MSKSCRMCGEILSHATCPHCGSQYSICDGCDHTEPGRRLPEPVTWSQEPPPLGTDCAVGWWEGDEWGYEFITVTQDTLLFRDGSEWFAPITVPQPPGEVGP